MNVPTYGMHNYTDIVDWIDEHYKQIRKRDKPIALIDLSTRDNPNYWLNKLYKYKYDITPSDIYINVDIEHLWRLTTNG